MKNKTLTFIVIATILIGGAILWGQSSGNKEAMSGVFSTDTAGLPEAKQNETVELKDGDTFDLTAGFVKKNINGKEVRMLAYNGRIPGPTIKIQEGATITVNFKNDTDMANTIHSHGVRMENAFDGVPDVTQPAVSPGDSFAYTLSFPDAGAYWYHPHMRDDYNIEMGLYGNFLVTPAPGSSWNPVDREVPIFVDDILLLNGKIAPFKKDEADHTLMGRYGNTAFINGETDYTLLVKKNEVVRFYFTNSANVRPFNLALLGAKMKLVGGDNGLYERDMWKDEVLVNPSERAIVEVLFDTPGEYALQSKTPERTYTLGTIIVSHEQVASETAKSFATLRAHPEVIKSIDPFRQYFDVPHQRRLALSVDTIGNTMQMMGGGMMTSNKEGLPTGQAGIEWEDDMAMMNQMSDTSLIKWKIVDQDTGKENMDIDWSFKRGAVKIRIENTSNGVHSMQHPIHFHGQRFLVVNQNGTPQTNLAWKDTVLVPSGQTVDILLDASNPGAWVAHCHILEHIEAGMAFSFKVQ